jgi:hypothetical protein
MMTIPSVTLRRQRDEIDDDRNGNAHHRQPTRSTRLSTRAVNTGITTRSNGDNADAPFGLKRTTFTGAECLLRVARYSTLGGRGTGGLAASLDAASTRDGGVMFG